jgi:hypothetical protein
MLNLGIKSVIFLLSLGLLACTPEDKSLERRKAYTEFAIHDVGTKDYLGVYSKLNDSVQTWAQNGLGYYRYLGYSKAYVIDSLLSFNTKKERVVGALLMKQLLTEGVQDDIWFMYGVRIKDHWYFYSGPTVVLPREYYQKDTHTPLSFEKLHEIAMKEIFSGFLKKDEEGEWQINDRFFDQVVPKSNEPVASGFGECFTCKSQEEYVMYVVRKNWQYRDTTKMAKPGPPI